MLVQYGFSSTEAEIDGNIKYFIDNLTGVEVLKCWKVALYHPIKSNISICLKAIQSLESGKTLKKFESSRDDLVNSYKYYMKCAKHGNSHSKYAQKKLKMI